MGPLSLAILNQDTRPLSFDQNTIDIYTMDSSFRIHLLSVTLSRRDGLAGITRTLLSHEFIQQENVRIVQSAFSRVP